MYLNDLITLYDMNQTGGQKLKYFFYILKISIAILRHLEAKFDYDYFILIFALKSHNSTRQISSHFSIYDDGMAFFSFITF